MQIAYVDTENKNSYVDGIRRAFICNVRQLNQLIQFHLFAFSFRSYYSRILYQIITNLKGTRRNFFLVNNTGLIPLEPVSFRYKRMYNPTFVVACFNIFLFICIEIQCARAFIL
ncbi:hypothetical protein PUN28_006843 [Cardiocondyla obscurior]|uniref:Uncharacterized protein n=1 Tax=Cardiocondyla obscurior TaxID=286306 RepID=A0AAW2G573_9HYME